jgi:hypothetical protein
MLFFVSRFYYVIKVFFHKFLPILSKKKHLGTKTKFLCKNQNVNLGEKMRTYPGCVP